MSQTVITFPLPIAIVGQLADTLDHDCLSYVSEEASAEIPFGVMIMKGAADFGALLVNAANAIPVGVLVHAFVYDNGPNGELGLVGLKPKAAFNVMRSGRIYVMVEENVTAMDRAYVRYAAGAGGTQLGAFRKTSVVNETIDVRKNCQFLTSASAGDIATLAVDMMNS